MKEDKRSELAKIFDVEQRHYDEVKRQTDNCSKDEIYLDIGSSFSDCIKYKIASEELGYIAEEVGCGWGGYPSSFLLKKKK